MHISKALRTLAFFAAISHSSAGEIHWASLRCPGEGGANLPTPTYGTEKAVFQICSQVVINASPAAVYHALLDFQSYPQWNSFVVNVALPAGVTKTPDDLFVGAATTFTTWGILPLINSTSTEIVTAMKPELPGGGGHRMVAWRSDDGAAGTLHRAEHPTILVDLGDATMSISYEPYYAGLATGAISVLKPTLQRLFEQQNLDLKAYVDGLN
ncbi:hypothetical protein RB595_003819 [Gaeumannomyces hyphopodioides]